MSLIVLLDNWLLADMMCDIITSMASTFHYHFSKTSWGVVVWLTCEATFCNENTEVSEYVAINDHLYLEMREKFSEEECGYLLLGLRLIAEQIEASAPSECVLLTVSRVDLALTDYQPEGLACAIMGWAGEHFGFTPPSIPISYNRQRNRYDFDFAETQ